MPSWPINGDIDWNTKMRAAFGVEHSLVDGTHSVSGTVVQVVNLQDGDVQTWAATDVEIPNDDTIPTSSEGVQAMTLSITPTSATNKLKIEVITHTATNTPSSGAHTVALFQDSGSAAIAVGANQASTTSHPTQVALTHYMTAGTTSATTFKVRIGTNSSSAANFIFNGVGSTRQYGGVLASSITITEIQV